MARNTDYIMGYIAVKEENRVQIATRTPSSGR
jgi:hypothetical protein